jgi:hypothetical protein
MKDWDLIDSEFCYVYIIANCGKSKIQYWGKLYLGKKAYQTNGNFLKDSHDIGAMLMEYSMGDSTESDELYEKICKFAENDREKKREAKELEEKRKAEELERSRAIKVARKERIDILRRMFREKKYVSEFFNKLVEIEKHSDQDKRDIQYYWNQYLGEFQKVALGPKVKCIYRWRHTQFPTLQYVGQTGDLWKRIKDHIGDIAKPTSYLHKAMFVTRPQDWACEILEEGDDLDLDLREAHYIVHYKSLLYTGLNRSLEFKFRVDFEGVVETYLEKKKGRKIELPVPPPKQSKPTLGSNIPE